MRSADMPNNVSNVPRSSDSPVSDLTSDKQVIHGASGVLRGPHGSNKDDNTQSSHSVRVSNCALNQPESVLLQFLHNHFGFFAVMLRKNGVFKLLPNMV